jgi:hypothetical protein
MAERRQGGARAPTARAHELTAAEAARHGLARVAELTGKEPEGVSGVEPLEDGWLVTVEILEDRRIPSTTDLLSTYETEIGVDGELLACRRVRRYSRGRGDICEGD